MDRKWRRTSILLTICLCSVITYVGRSVYWIQVTTRPQKDRSAKHASLSPESFHSDNKTSELLNSLASSPRQQSRLHQIHAVCNQTRSRDINMTSRHPYWRLLVDNRHGVIFCVIPKVACTTMKTLFALTNHGELQLQNLKGKISESINGLLGKLDLRYLNHYTQEERLNLLKEYKKVIVVRHPLSRLYSAFDDKIAHKDLKHSKSYAVIVRKYFPSGIDANGKLDLDFKQFLSMIAMEYKRGRFVNRHWMSYDDLCHPCNIHYDYVAKLETMLQDMDYLTFMLGLEPRETLPKLNSRSDKEELLLDSIPRDLLKGIMRIYERDFRLFGYDLPNA